MPFKIVFLRPPKLVSTKNPITKALLPPSRKLSEKKRLAEPPKNAEINESPEPKTGDFCRND